MNQDSESSIFIDEHCMFSYDTIVYNTDSHAIFSGGHLTNKACQLHISSHSWIGWGARILKNSFLASNTIVGLGAIVSGSFNEGHCIIAGCPAKIIKKNVEWTRKCVNDVVNET